jgi:hypothetical protein
LVAKAEQDDLAAIQQIADRLDGKAAQTIEGGDVTVGVLSDHELFRASRSPPLVDELAIDQSAARGYAVVPFRFCARRQ